MTRKEQLQFCKVCQHQKFDSKKGLLCGLTNEYAKFETECISLNLIEGKQLPQLNLSKEKARKERSFHLKSFFRLYAESDYLNAITITLVAFTLGRLLTYPLDLSEWLYKSVLIFGIYVLLIGIGLTQISNPKKGFILFRKFQFVLLISLGTTLLNFIYVKLCLPSHTIYFFDNFFEYLLLTYLGYIISILFKLWIKKWIRRKFRRIVNTTSITLIILLGSIQSALLIPNEFIFWQNAYQLSQNNFKGIPNYLSGYSAAIHSTFEIKYVSADSVYIPAYCRADQSWMKKRGSSDFLLNHEQYHFNITELIARKTRKKIFENHSQAFSQHAPWLFTSALFSELNELQDKYDSDTKHGVHIEAQMDWQFLVDSLLLEYDAYSSPYVTIKTDTLKKSHYRHIDLSNNFKLEPLHPVPEKLHDIDDCYELIYDKKGRISCVMHKRNGAVVPDDVGRQILRIKYTNNAETRMNFNANGKPEATNSGTYGCMLKIEDNRLSRIYLDTNENPMEDAYGTAYEIYQLNDEGQPEKGRFFDLKLAKSVNRFGFHNLRYTYDDKENIVLVENISPEGELVANKEGFAKVEYGYDSFKNLRYVKLLDINGKPAEDNDGFAMKKTITDRNGRINCEAYYNKFGYLIPDENGIAYTFKMYDDYGNLVHSANYGRNRNIVCDERGYGRVLRVYDSLQRVTQIKNYDAYYMLTEVEDGFSVREIQYESDNNQIIYDYTSKHPYIEDLKIKQVAREILKNDRVVEHIFLDENLNPSVNQDSIARIRYDYDELGKKIKKAYYAIDGDLKPDTRGISYECYAYDNSGNLTEKYHYQGENKLLVSDSIAAIERYAYDSYGGTTLESYYDAFERPTENNKGYASCTYNFNSSTQTLTIEYFDSEGNRTPTFDQVSVIKQLYNEKGNVQQLTYFNKELKPQADSSGIAVYLYRYNEAQNLTHINYFGEDYMPVTTSEGYSEFKLYYDKNDNVIIQQGFDMSNQLVEDSTGAATFWWEYDRNGNAINSRTLSAEETALEELIQTGFNRQMASLPSSMYFDAYTAYSANTAFHTSSSLTPELNTLTTWYHNNQKESEGTYINGKLEGSYITWYESGQMQSKIDYVDGKMNGYYITYHENGKVESMRLYKENTLVTDQQQTWYDDGQLRSEYVNGEYQEYDPDGNRII